MNDTGSPRRGRREDDRLTTGRGRYADDVAHPGALHVAFVRSPHPSALIRSIDTSEALSSPGVVAVFTGQDVLDGGLIDAPAPSAYPRATAPSPRRRHGHKWPASGCSSSVNRW